MPRTVPRASRACNQCRAKKRRCDGAQPCQLCSRLGSECIYISKDGRQRHGSAQSPSPARFQPSSTSVEGSTRGESTANKSGERDSATVATSGVASVGLVALHFGTGKAQKRVSTPWNLGFELASEKCLGPVLRDILDWENFARLASVYFAKIHPLYGTFDEETFWSTAQQVWMQGGEEAPCHELVFSSVAALGFLFQHNIVAHAQIVESGTRHFNLHLTMDRVYTQDADGLILRTLYLRLTAGPHVSWLASCTTIGVLCSLPQANSWKPRASFPANVRPQDRTQAEDEALDKRKLLAMLLNAWISNESGQPRPFDSHLGDRSVGLPAWVEAGPTGDLLQLWSMSEVFNPSKLRPDPNTLATVLTEVCEYSCDHDVVILSRTNLAIVIYRRLRSVSVIISTDQMESLIRVCMTGLEAVKRLVEDRQPWHHVANLPFQVLCVLLLLDNPESLSNLVTALLTIKFVATTFDTAAARGAFLVATNLVSLAQKRKDEDTTSLSAALEISARSERVDTRPSQMSVDDAFGTGLIDGPDMEANPALDFPKWDDIDWDHVFDHESTLWDQVLPST